MERSPRKRIKEFIDKNENIKFKYEDIQDIQYYYDSDSDYHERNDGLFIKINNKWGFINFQDEIVIEPQFKNLEHRWIDGFTVFMNEDKQGIINTKGEIVWESEIGKWFWDVNIPIRNEGQGKFVFYGFYKCGYIDFNRNLFIEPQYEDIILFRDPQEDRDGDFLGVAKVMANELKYGVINVNKKKVIIEPQYDGILLSNGELLGVQVDGKWGVINIHTKKFIIEPIYHYVRFFYGISGVEMIGLLKNDDNKWWIANNEGLIIFKSRGKVNIEPEYDSSGNICFFIVNNWGGEDSVINLKGEILWNKLNFITSAYTAPGFLAISNERDEMGVINVDGDLVIKMEYNRIVRHEYIFIAERKDRTYIIFNLNGQILHKVEDCILSDYVLASTENFFVNVKGKWGIMNVKGEIVKEPQWDDYYSDGYKYDAIVGLNGKFGVVNTEGKYILPPQFDAIDFQDHYFSYYTGKKAQDCFYKIKMDGKWGLANVEGDILFEPQWNFHSVNYFNMDEEAILLVEVDGAMGLADTKGNELLKPIYNRVEIHEEEAVLRITTSDNKDGLANFKGEILLEPQFYDMENLSHGVYRVTFRKSPRSRRYYGLIDIDGSILLEPKCTKIETDYDSDAQADCVEVYYNDKNVVKYRILYKNGKTILEPI